jgi:hypothetical protein
MPLAPARTVVPQRGPDVWPRNPEWVELANDEVGLGWYEAQTDFNVCPSCFEVGTNGFVVLAADLQSAMSNVASLRLQTAEAGFVARRAASLGETVLVVGIFAYNLWQESASATLRCTR